MLRPHSLSVHTLEANISHDTANDPAHQRHAAFMPACFALPSGTAPRKRTSHQGRANPNGPMALRHHERTLATRSVHTLEANISLDTANDPAHQRHAAFTPACFALPSGTAPRKRNSHQGRANPNGTVTSRTYFGHTVCPHTRKQTLKPPKIPLTSDTPRLRQHVSRSPVARRHANTLPTKAAQIPMAL